jgi:hypothetical protein
VLLYEIASGLMWDMAPSGAFGMGRGYSGSGIFKNDPDRVATHHLGPLPPGAYRIGPPFTHPELGVLTFTLIPMAGQMYGRSEFRIHGDSKEHPGEASHGCIVLEHEIREEISVDFVGDILVVVPVMP